MLYEGRLLSLTRRQSSEHSQHGFVSLAFSSRASHNDPALKALLRELRFSPATGDGDSFEDWMYTWWFFELRKAHHADLGGPKAWLRLNEEFDFDVDDS